jgi:hypothetical protein
MWDPVWDARRCTGRPPHFAEVPDGHSIPIEDPGNDRLRSMVEGLGPLPLFSEDLLDGREGPKREKPTLIVLRRPGLESGRLGGEIDLSPLEALGLALPPASEIEKRDEGPEIFGEMAEEGSKVSLLKEAHASVADFEGREDGALGDLPDLHRESERSLQRREVVLDRRKRRPRLLTGPNIRLEAVGGDVVGPIVAEEASEPFDRELDRAGTSAD